MGRGPSDLGYNAALLTDRSDAHARNVLTVSELAAHPTLRHATVYDAVLSLRPEYLTITTVRGGSAAPSRPNVLVNEGGREGLEALRGIDASLVREIRFVRPAEAVTRYGREYATGVIVVTTIKP